MNKFKEVKSMLTNREVVERYLGTPIKRSSTGNWYKSPFRNERTASFCVSDKGIHDFGTSIHYDIISFVAEYFRVDSKTALEIISRDFNINICNEYETNKTLEIVKRNRRLEKEAKEKINKWFNEKIQEICDKIQINQKCIEYMSEYKDINSLTILYNEEMMLENEFETLFNATEEEKPQLYLEYKKEK